MTPLRQLLEELSAGAEFLQEVPFSGPIELVTNDSAKVRPGCIFVAIAGEKADGHDFVGAAAAAGCSAVVLEKKITLPANITAVMVPDSRQAYGELAAAFYRCPAREMTVIGLTGTNGKTTASWIIEQMLRSAGLRTGVIGTVNYRYSGSDNRQVVREAALTTPEPVMLHGLLREMLDAGVTHVIMEVSSHALVQQRLAGLVFDVAVFTNLSRDHLDYHLNMENYYAAKRQLFTKYLAPQGSGVIVLDDNGSGQEKDPAWGRRLQTDLLDQGFSAGAPDQAGRKLIGCGFGEECRVRARELSLSRDGFTGTLVMDDVSLPMRSGLIGRHNVLNSMAAAGVGLALGIAKDKIGRGLQQVGQVPGRLEKVELPRPGKKEQPSVFVDYAHTPDALANVLRSMRPLTPGRLVCVFGCGGDRDRGKRPLMGAIAGRLADRVIITSDNPRSEPPLAIMAEIEAGIKEAGIRQTDLQGILAADEGKKYLMLEDRRAAIHAACSMAGRNDLVLIAGKGHENYQICGAERRYFDDRLEAENGSLRWTPDHLLAGVSGELVSRGTSLLFNAISTDTRTIGPGDVFVALKGDNFDGHDFIGRAVDRGAAAVVLSDKSRKPGKEVTVVRVPDTLRALGDLAAYRRRALGGRLLVAAITGSTGKTTVKEMTAAIFEVHHSGSPQRVLKTAGNLNNLIGLPLTLLQADAGRRAAVLEMGMNRPGEIRRLTEIAAPDIGCITNVQPAHLEGLGTIEGVAAAKLELFFTMPRRGAVRVVNDDDPHIRPGGRNDGDSIVSFAVTPFGRKQQPTVKATRIISQGEEGMRFTLHIAGWRERITVPATGMHNVANCAAAAAIATAAGITPEVIVLGLRRYKSGDKRLQIVRMANNINIVNDAYNANPASMQAALETVRGFGSGCTRVAVLGDMLELGAGAPGAHRQVGALAAGFGYDYLAVTGNFAGEMAAAARAGGMAADRIMVCATTGEVADRLTDLHNRQAIRAGDWIVIKGSRGMRMERVLAALEQNWGKKG